MLKGKDLLSIHDLSVDEVNEILALAHDLKAKQKAGIEHHLLKGKTLGMIFEKSSTRTRLSFETGMYQLGGQALFLSNRDLQLGRGEPIKDTARVMSRYLDGIMIRTFGHDRVEELSKAMEEIVQSLDVIDQAVGDSATGVSDIANKTNGIVIGTGDLSELALGWCTYNGDQMSMYGVNSSIPKTLVRYLVDWFAEDSDDEKLSAVLKDILDTPVSPELLPPKDGQIAQKTEDLVGPYELHDFYLYYLLRFGFSPSKLLFLADCSELPFDHDFKLKWLRTFYRRFFTQQFKRSCMPDGAKVGTVNLSPRGDWRMPSDASASVWLEEIDRLK